MSGRGVPGLPPLLAVAGLLAVWQMMARLSGSGTVPDVPATLAELPALLGDPQSVRDILSSLRRMALGFAIAVVVAAPVGLAMGRSRTVSRLLTPLLMMSYPVPKAALMPLVMLWFGVGDASKLLVIALAVSLPVIFHAQAGAAAVEPRLLWSAAAMGMSPFARAVRIVAPAALPEVLVGCRTGLVLALITMVTSEMIARQTGIGNLLFGALDMAQYETVYATIVLVGAMGVLLDILFEAARQRLTGWADPAMPIAASGAE